MTLTPSELAEVVAAVRADLDLTPSPLAVGGFFQVSPGQTILSDHMNTAMVNGVPKFADAAARDAAWPSPPVGAMCYLTSLNYLQTFGTPIAGSTAKWRATAPLRMGYGDLGNNQVIPNTTETRLIIAGSHGAAGAPGRATWTNGLDYVTVPLAGTYIVTARVRWPANATGERTMWIKRYYAGNWTISGVAGGMQQVATPGSSILRMSCSAIVDCSAGDRIAVSVYQSSGGGLTLPPAGPPNTVDDVGSMGLTFLGED